MARAVEGVVSVGVLVEEEVSSVCLLPVVVSAMVVVVAVV